MAQNDLYVLTLEGGNLGSLTRQDFCYKCIGNDGSTRVEELISEFRNHVVPKIAGICSTAMVYTRIVGKNLFDPEDWSELVLNPDETGQRPGQQMPAFVAAAFRTSKPASNVPPSRKRFGYLSESDVDGRFLVQSGTFLVALTDLVGALGLYLGAPYGDIYSPHLIRRIKYTTSTGKTAYRYPANQGEAISYETIDWFYEPLVTAQMTRKTGRGI